MKPSNLITHQNWKFKRPNKFKAKKRRIDDITFDSIKESEFYVMLREQRKLGQVVMFHRQVIFDLPGGTTYRCDFQVFYPDGKVRYIDVKGRKTKGYIKAKKQVESLYPVEIEEV